MVDSQWGGRGQSSLNGLFINANTMKTLQAFVAAKQASCRVTHFIVAACTGASLMTDGHPRHLAALPPVTSAIRKNSLECFIFLEIYISWSKSKLNRRRVDF